MIKDFMVNNNGVNISYYKVNEASGGKPLVIIPGAINSAEEVMSAFSSSLPIYHIIISLRGRGKSDSPETHYSLDDQASDIQAVVHQEKLSEYFLFGHSFGSSIAIRAAVGDKAAVKGLIMGDFPPFYPPFDKSWASRILWQNDLHISKTAVEGLANSAKYIDLASDVNSLECSLVALQATKEDAVIRSEDVEGLRRLCPNVLVKELPNTGHEMLIENPTVVAEILKEIVTQ
ncbi:MAG: alpha/beta hydrolase [Bacteroidetes bacterium]|nr:alpha/beta hydrolase [Bacteroidota bacterium]